MTYDSKHLVILTVGEWLDIRCALLDAATYNEEHGFAATAEKNFETFCKLKARTDHALDLADAAAQRVA